MHTQFSIYAPREPKVARLCRQCGTTFLVWASTVRTTPRHFCSQACRVVWFGDEQRFWEQLEIGPNNCWFWTGCLHKAGYGVVSWRGRQWLTHRLAWTLKRGPIPAGKEACHTCDVYWQPGDVRYRRCSNPAHLFLGTKADNIKDMYAKGRGDPQGHKKGLTLRGEQSAASLLTNAAVATIRLHAADARVLDRPLIKRLAEQFDVDERTIVDVIRRRTWRHIA